jgi:multicomponent Na+:H+ antiporter subunit G
MNEVISAILLFVGAAFLLLAALGVVRMPDLFSRMQAASKASALGISCMLLAVAVHFEDLGVTTRSIATIVFFILTTPVTAHMIARAAYFIGVPLWEGTIIDELRGRYNPLTHSLSSGTAKVYEQDESGEARRLESPGA